MNEHEVKEILLLYLFFMMTLKAVWLGPSHSPWIWGCQDVLFVPFSDCLIHYTFLSFFLCCLAASKSYKLHVAYISYTCSGLVSACFCSEACWGGQPNERQVFGQYNHGRLIWYFSMNLQSISPKLNLKVPWYFSMTLITSLRPNLRRKKDM